jgi:hypothetical protein
MSSCSFSLSIRKLFDSGNEEGKKKAGGGKDIKQTPPLLCALLFCAVRTPSFDLAFGALH